MGTLWRAIVRTLFWSYERMSWPYDALVAAILLFVFFSPLFLHYDDQPQTGPVETTAQVSLLGHDLFARTKTFRVDAALLKLPKPKPELERETHDILRKRVEDLRDNPFHIERIEAVHEADGSVLYFKVWVKQ